MEELGIGFVAYSPLGRGFLTGAFGADTRFTADDFRAQNPRFTPDALKHNTDLVMALRNVALRKGTTPAQSALAWLLAKKPWIVPIRNRTRLEENAGAMLLQLTADEMIAIEHAIATHSVEGDRYDERGLKTVNL